MFGEMAYLGFYFEFLKTFGSISSETSVGLFVKSFFAEKAQKYIAAIPFISFGFCVWVDFTQFRLK